MTDEISADPLLIISDLSVSYERWGQRVRALDSVNLSISRSDWVMLIGHNGSGKSTLLRVAAEQIYPDTGRVTWLDEGAEKRKRPAPFLVEQNPMASTSPTLTIFENLYASDNTGAREPKKTLRCKYQEMLKSLGLADRMDTLVRYLSGGERQLLSLLIASLSPRPLLLLDEPLAALDPDKAKLCLEVISRLHQDGRAIVQVSHDHDMANSHGNRTITMQSGRIIGEVRREGVQC